MSDNGWPAELPPPGKADPGVLRKWLDDGLYYTHRIRVADTSAHRRAELYDACYQWLKKAQAGYDTIGASQWVQDYWDPSDPNFIDTPVFNEGLPARMNESARLGRPNYRPVAHTKGENPGIQERQGAKKLQDMLRHRLEEMGWNVEKELAYYHMPVYRGVWIKSEWENRYDDLTTVPVKGAVKCPGGGCGFTLASKSVPFALASKMPALAENAAEQVGQDTMDVQACPTCPDHPPMRPFNPSMQEAVTGQDAVGRPLGQQLPKGDWWLSIRNADDMFPRNLGMDMRPGHIDEWREAHVEHLDWVALRYPQKAGLVKPESAASLAKFHPIAGAPDVYQSIIDVKTFESSVRIKEGHKKPWMERTVGPDGQSTFKLNRGRSVVMAGDVVLLDAPFLLDDINQPGQTVERVFVDYIPWEVREGGRRLEGLGLWDMIFDAQDVGNTIWSQAGAVRERLALPIYAVARTFNFEIQALKGGIPGRLAEFDIDPNATTARPELINNTTIAEGAWRELDNVTAAIHDRYTGNSRIEGGSVPPGVDAAQAIRELKEASGEKREPRIRRIRTGFKRAFAHGGRLMQALYIEPRPCKYEDEDGEERWKSLTGLELGSDVEVDVEPEEVDADEKRMQVKDLIGSGVINLADPNTPPALRRRVARYLAPEAQDLYEDQDLQEKSAQREYVRFKEENRVPVVDPSLDEHLEHYQDHGRQAHSEWFRDKEDAANWDAALNIIAPTWNATLQAVAQAALAPALPPGSVDPTTGQPAPPAMSVQMRLMQAWTGQLDAAQFKPGPTVPQGVPPPDPTEAEDALAIVLAWRAHMEAHKLEAEVKQMRAQVQPTVAAPGGEATAAGNQPTAGSPAAASPPMPGPAVNSQNQPAGVH